MVDSVDCIEHNSYSPETRGKEREKQREKELREEGKCEKPCDVNLCLEIHKNVLMTFTMKIHYLKPRHFISEPF
jgi:hypothetical protein